ncbi:chemotaxis protein histidine kinase CheA [Thioploca ingrica]|uniref:Chemotaxis protein CheA n=1 Tax=Thioploca ingrica TaxID=40754 RepID=A0A090AGZ3_9GAMM|nr:chemotaxis protein histidine kinase CheA [Thioploca ingrica]
MPVDLTEVRALFFEESFENLDLMESNLLDLEIGSLNKELINSIFRAAHSIKGGGGIFKLEQLVTFAHVAETLLDEMRNGEHLITQTLIDLLLRAVDIMRMMLSTLQENATCDMQPVQACQHELLNTVKKSMADKQVREEALKYVELPLEPTPVSSAPLVPDNLPQWQIIFKPHPSMLTKGNDPINLFHELSNLGSLDIKVNTSQLPNLNDLDPQSCYLSWELTLQAQVERAIIEEIFEWVEDECELQITSLSPSPSSSVTGSEPTFPVLATVEPEESIATNELVVQETSQSNSEPTREPLFATPATITPLSNDMMTSAVPPLQPQTAVTDKIPMPSPSSVGNKAALESIRDNNANPNLTHHTAEANSIRVNIDKIDKLINLVGELVITQSMLDQVKDHLDHTHMTQLHNGLSQLERNTRELQESVMRIRMLPINYSFNRFPRLVHDLSTQLGKKVELKLSGEHTELDKTVLEKMSDPLVHLVRNALDHGIELPIQRRAVGKIETGRVHLHAFHQGGNIIIQISDDGAGFDLEKIQLKAIEKGLLTAEDYPTEEQLYEFIFLPGFSTAKQVSNLSGRGVGMDVVRRNIRALGGTIEVVSRPGKGSTFTIRLPLTLAILDGQLVRVGKEIYILSLLSIIESLRIKPNLVNSLAGKAEIYRLREEYIPILRLYGLFDITPSTTQLDQGLLVIVEGDGQKIGLFVDELLSQQQIVIKSLESNYQQVQGISGATILGDGSVALILDVAGLIQLFYSQTQLSPLRSRLGFRSAS